MLGWTVQRWRERWTPAVCVIDWTCRDQGWGKLPPLLTGCDSLVYSRCGIGHLPLCWCTALINHHPFLSMIFRQDIVTTPRLSLWWLENISDAICSHRVTLFGAWFISLMILYEHISYTRFQTWITSSKNVTLLRALLHDSYRSQHLLAISCLLARFSMHQLKQINCHEMLHYSECQHSWNDLYCACMLCMIYTAPVCSLWLHSGWVTN